MVKTISGWTVKMGNKAGNIDGEIGEAGPYGEASVQDIVRVLIEYWNANHRKAVVWAEAPGGEVIAALFPNGMLIDGVGADRTRDYPYLYMIMTEGDAAAKYAAYRLAEAARSNCKNFSDDVKAPFDWRMMS